MKKVTQLNHYEILNLQPTATRADIQNAYSRLCRTYQADSLAVYSIVSDEELEDIQERIEKAYSTLYDDVRRREYDRSLGLGNFDVVKKQDEKASIFEGAGATEGATGDESEDGMPDPLNQDFLKSYREKKGISLREISESTNISIYMLSALENGEYNRLPGRAYAIGFLRDYAKYIGMDYQRAKQNLDHWAKW